MKFKILLLYACAFSFSFSKGYSQIDNRIQDDINNFQNEFILNLSKNHLLQKNWSPYRNQPFFDLSYLWYLKNQKILVDTGLSISLDFNGCQNCVTSPSSENVTFDADIISLHGGIAKWWKKNQAAVFLSGGGIFAYSEYRQFLPNTNGTYYDYVDSSRYHAGIYIKFGADWKVAAGADNKPTQLTYRLGPFIETIFSTGQTQKNLNLNMNSVAIGLMMRIHEIENKTNNK